MFGYCSCKQDTQGQQFCQMKRDISFFSDQNDQASQSGLPSKVVLSIPVRPNRNGPLHLISYRNFRNFELNGKRPQLPAQPQNDH